MPASALSTSQTRSEEVAERVATVWKIAWENRTRLDARNSSSWKPLHSYAGSMVTTSLTQCQDSNIALSKQRKQQQPSAAPQVNHGDAHQSNFDGGLPSVGSEGHFDGTCKRCAFFPKGRCLNGKDCTHCHFPHDPRPRNRKRRMTKSQRSEEAHEATELPEDDNMSDDSYPTESLQDSAGDPELARASDLVYARLLTINESEDEHEAEVHSDRGASTPNDISDSELRPADMRTLNHALQNSAKLCTADVLSLAQGKDSTSECGRNDAGDADSTSISSLGEGDESATTSSIDSEPEPASIAALLPTCASSETSSSDISPLLESTSQAPSDQAGSAPKSSTRERSTFFTSSTSWAAMRRSQQAAASQNCPPVHITRMTRALLNKLTEERFESLCSQILALPLSTPEQLAVVVKEIFHKATTQNGFRALYTELCLRLDVHLTAQTGVIGGKSFRKALVNECQATFERNLQPPDATLFDNLSGDESFELAMKLKTAILGNLRFIGDLLVRRLLSAKLLPPIVHTLLSGTEAELESLLALLEVVAPVFEGTPSLYQAPLHDAFAVLRRRVAEKSTCQRVRCQIQNLLDARARGWAPRSARC